MTTKRPSAIVAVAVDEAMAVQRLDRGDAGVHEQPGKVGTPAERSYVDAVKMEFLALAVFATGRSGMDRRLPPLGMWRVRSSFNKVVEGRPDAGPLLRGPLTHCASCARVAAGCVTQDHGTDEPGEPGTSLRAYADRRRRRRRPG